MKFFISFASIFLISICFAFSQYKLDYFNCKLLNDNILLTWKTLEENGIDTFYLYSSSDGLNWQEIHRQQNRNIKTGNNYNFATKSFDGYNYFKIKYNYSILYTSWLKSSKITFFENCVFLDSNTYDQFIIFDLFGRNVQTLNSGFNYFKLQTGYYFLINQFDNSFTKFFVNE